MTIHNQQGKSQKDDFVSQDRFCKLSEAITQNFGKKSAKFAKVTILSGMITRCLRESIDLTNEIPATTVA